MTRRALALAAVVTAAACSSIGESGAPVAIEFLVPIPAAVDIGDTIQLHARVLDTNGDSVAATIRWSTPDANVHVDSITGRFWATSGTSGRVQPRSGSLVGPSPATPFAVHPYADTLIVTAAAESLLVTLSTDSVSGALSPKVAQTDGTGIGDQGIVFTLVAPTPAGIRFTGNDSIRTVSSGSNGEPATPVRVRSFNAAAGDTAFVRVDARMPSGKVVAGSGQVIRVFFK